MDATLIKLDEIAEVISGVGDERLSSGSYRYYYYQPNSFLDADGPISLPTLFRDEPVLEKHIVKRGDVIVKRLNHDRAYMAEETEGSTTISQNLFIVRTSDGRCLPEYLAFLFEQQEILLQISQVSGTAAPIRAISVKMLHEISIPLIPLEKQRSIGALWKLSKRKQSLLKKLEAENGRLMTAVYNKYIGNEVE